MTIELSLALICPFGDRCSQVPSHVHRCCFCNREDGTLTKLPLTVCGPDGTGHGLAVHSSCGQILVLNSAKATGK